MLSFSTASYPVHDDDTVTSASSNGRLIWEPHYLTLGLTQAAPSQSHCMATSTSTSIAHHDVYIVMGQPFVAELPRPMLRIIAEDPASKVANEYRQHVVNVLMPGCRRVSQLLKNHSAVIVSFQWLLSLCGLSKSCIGSLTHTHRVRTGMAKSKLASREVSQAARRDKQLLGSNVGGLSTGLRENLAAMGERRFLSHPSHSFTTFRWLVASDALVDATWRGETRRACRHDPCGRGEHDRPRYQDCAKCDEPRSSVTEALRSPPCRKLYSIIPYRKVVERRAV